MQMNRVWAMPNKWTFTIKPIKELLNEEVDIKHDIWVDPFAGKYSLAQYQLAQYQNDINPALKVGSCKDVLEYLKEFKTNSIYGVLLDPPYSLKQVSEHYKKAGIKVTGWHTSMQWASNIKNEAARIIKVGGKVICFGWSSMGLGKNRGFKMKRILLVPHGGSKNDTIVTVEKKK